MKSCPECTATYPDDYAICPKDGAPLEETTLWQIGTVVRGKYRILARLGEGGMAVVYKAQHELLDELRALKVIKPELAHDPEFMSRFKNEAIMARKLNHPSAVRVDDLDIAEDGLPYISMELVVGDTLKTLVQRTGPLPVTLVLDVAWHVCDALDAAHKLGLIHRDIKPENIVLVAQREGLPLAKILDFGISRLREETAGAKGLTQTGMVIGTPEYMSPEQAQGKRGSELDGRSDLYSLGVVMYRMLTGEMPFPAENTVEMLLHHLKTPPVAPHQLKPTLGIPEAVSAIVMKAMEKDPEKRFATGAEMAAAIKKVRGSTTRPSHKIDLRSVSAATASFGAEGSVPGLGIMPAGPSSPAGVVEKPLFRTSARLGPPPKAFPTRLVLAVLMVAVLATGGFVGWKYFQARNPQVPALGKQPAKVLPANPPSLSSPETPKTTETPPPAPAVPAPVKEQPAGNKKLTYDDQAKILELNSLADIYARQGGCEKALPVYQQVLQIDPDNSRAYAAIKDCYAKARGGGTPETTTKQDAPPAP
jgi:serine/threonine-protein kinase